MTEVIKNTYAHTIEHNMKDKKKTQELIKLIGHYVDKNTDNLVTIGPVRNIVFWDTKDRQPVFDLTGIPKESLATTAKKVHELSRSVNASDPFNLLMVLLIRYYRITKQEAARKSCVLYLSLSMWPSLFSKYFKYEPNESIMEYTINHLSGKYKIRQEGTLLAMIQNIVYIADEHYAREITRGNDKDFATFITAIKTRLNQALKGICSEFVKVHDTKAFLNYESDNEDPDNFSVADNNSLLVQRISQAIVLQISVHGPDMKCITLAAKMNKVSVNDIRSTIVSLCKDKSNRDDINTVVSSIVYDFLFNGKNSSDEIKSTKFTLYTIEAFRRSNTTNSSILKVKEIIHKWLTKYSKRYTKTNMVGTINQFRRAIYMFWVFTIQRTRI